MSVIGVEIIEISNFMVKCIIHISTVTPIIQVVHSLFILSVLTSIKQGHKINLMQLPMLSVWTFSVYVKS